MNKLLSFAVAILLLAGCKKNDKLNSQNENLAIPSAAGGPGGGSSACTINLNNLKQVIRGFGGSSAWNGQLTNADCDKLFSTLGLSLLRVRIDPNNNWSDEISNTQKAMARGAIVFGSPWSPPAYMKDNNNTV